MSKIREVKCDLRSLKKLAISFAEDIEGNAVFALYGNLGSGKTAFAKFFIRYFLNTEVTSPTFNLVNLYKTEKFTIWHFDLYRLNNVDEVYNLGIEDAFNYGLVVIEWPEIIENILPNNTTRIMIRSCDQELSRIVTIQSP